MVRDNTIRADALGRNDLRAKFGWSISSQKRAQAAGKFPPCYRIGRRLYWREETVIAWLAEQEAKATAQQGGNDDVS